MVRQINQAQLINIGQISSAVNVTCLNLKCYLVPCEHQRASSYKKDISFQVFICDFDCISL